MRNNSEMWNNQLDCTLWNVIVSYNVIILAEAVNQLMSEICHSWFS